MEPVSLYLTVLPSRLPTELVLLHDGCELGLDENSEVPAYLIKATAGTQLSGLSLHARNEVGVKLAPPFNDGCRLLIEGTALPKEANAKFMADGTLPGINFQPFRVPTNVADGPRSVPIQLLLSTSTKTRHDKQRVDHKISVMIRMIPLSGPPAKYKVAFADDGDIGGIAASISNEENMDKLRVITQDEYGNELSPSQICGLKPSLAIMPVVEGEARRVRSFQVSLPPARSLATHMQLEPVVVEPSTRTRSGEG